MFSTGSGSNFLVHEGIKPKLVVETLQESIVLY